MASSFTAADFEPVLDARGKHRKVEGRKLYRIRGANGDGMWFHIGHLGSGLAVHIPEGFVTDGPSIPPAVGWAVPKGAKEKAMKSAAVHDYLCEHPGFTRPEADAQFLIAMHAEGTPPLWREVFFRAVRYNNSKAIRDENAQLDLFDGRGPGA